MSIMFGNGRVKGYKGNIMRSEEFVATATTLPTAGTDGSGWKHQYEGPDGMLYAKLNPKFYDANGKVVKTLIVGDRYFCSYDVLSEGGVIDISATSFPGTYYVTGDTYARSAASGKDELTWNSSLVA